MVGVILNQDEAPAPSVLLEDLEAPDAVFEPAKLKRVGSVHHGSTGRVKGKVGPREVLQEIVSVLGRTFVVPRGVPSFVSQ